MRDITIRHLGVRSVAHFAGIVQAIIALITGAFIMVGGVIAVWSADYGWGILVKTLGTAAVVVGALILLPLFAYAIGWLYGVIVSLIANIFLDSSRGIRIAIEDEPVQAITTRK